MMRLLALFMITATITGCAVVQKGVAMIPSFWDDNQSAKIVDIRQSVAEITCEPGTQAAAAERVLSGIQWFKLYSESKGSRQKDVIAIVTPMEETARDWLDRTRKQGEGSRGYCTSKRMILAQQSRRAAESILGRF